jgi:hypothetical protein
MKRLILAGTLVLITTAAQAQGTGSNPSSHPVQGPYTTLGPAGAGSYVQPPQQTNPNGHQVKRERSRGTKKPLLG